MLTSETGPRLILPIDERAVYSNLEPSMAGGNNCGRGSPRSYAPTHRLRVPHHVRPTRRLRHRPRVQHRTQAAPRGGRGGGGGAAKVGRAGGRQEGLMLQQNDSSNWHMRCASSVMHATMGYDASKYPAGPLAPAGAAVAAERRSIGAVTVTPPRTLSIISPAPLASPIPVPLPVSLPPCIRTPPPVPVPAPAAIAVPRPVSLPPPVPVPVPTPPPVIPASPVLPLI